MSQSNYKANLLLAEDDVNLGYLLEENLEAKGFDVTLTQTGHEAMTAIEKNKYDLCIIDVMLPGTDGFSIGKALQKQNNGTPFIFLTARSMEQDRIAGFETGADDYVTKPFSFRELYYRILVVLRRKNHAAPVKEQSIVRIGDLSLNPADRTLCINNQVKKLSHREAGLLQMLMEQPDKFVTRSEILKTVWGNDDYFTAKSMDVYITRIRKLLKEMPSLEIENLYGTGYRIRVVV